MTTSGLGEVREATLGSDLLRRYRTLCEANGIARAHRLPLAAAASTELADLEARLIALLDAPAPAAVATPPPRLSAPPPPPTVATAPPESSRPQAPTTVTIPRTAPGAPVEPSRPPVPAMVSTAPATPAAASTVATVYTDGSAEGNPGPGGYCAIVRRPGHPDRELSGGAAHTTNNKMELMAAIVGLKGALEAGATEVEVLSDSEYLVKGMTQWLAGWRRKGWKTAGGQEVKNRDLWEQLAALVQGRTVRWSWIRGHAGHPENERCDTVATAAARRFARGATS